MSDEFGKNLDGNGHSLIETVSKRSTGGTGKVMRNLSQAFQLGFKLNTS
jgi:hypothetical protein